jgi:alpha-beta hydrolase superfamily lysophospholipase
MPAERRGALRALLPAYPGRFRVAVAVVAVLLAFLGATSAVWAARFAGDAIDQQSVDAFYTPPESLPDGPPGTIVRSQELLGTAYATRAWRILYLSTDLNGDPVLVSGVVIAPLGPAPAGGRTVLSWGHPTTGTAAACGPSRSFDPASSVEGLRMLLSRDYVVVYTDYAGMGVPGPDSYLVGATEGNNVLDAVRAAQHIEAAGAGDDVVLWGHSQGGQAVLFAAERAPQYAPELDIRAVAVAAPAADLTRLLDADIDDISGVTIGSYAFAAFTQVYRDVPGVTLDAILTPAAQKVNGRMNDLCLLSHTKELHEIGQPLVGDFVRVDPTTTEPWSRLLAENSAGSVPFDAPLFVAQGLADTLIEHTETEQFVEHERSMGMDVTYHPVAVADHGTIAYLSVPALAGFLDDIGE